ncbi:MAG TPA: DinB family protein [Longimicrobiales bacterium]|nr:DinB family protein [Longimicrobiales bacterium]
MITRPLAAALSLALLCPLALRAQDGAVVTSLKGLHDVTRGYLTSTAEVVPEDLYSFRPTEEVRTLGQILAHVANSQFVFCSAAAGEENPNTEDFEETRTTKEQIAAALEEGFSYCDGVYGKMSDETGTAMRTFFGQEMAASGVLAFNSAHNYEHYGNLVTYMRINGIVPPSSR